MRVHVLLYDPGTDNEGIHSLELKSDTVVLMFENRDDAERYSMLLEAQDFPTPTVEELDKEEIEAFCNQQGYQARLIVKGFMPTNEEDRLFLTPPERNKDVSNWNEREIQSSVQEAIDKSNSNKELELFRKKLEDLL